MIRSTLRRLSFPRRSLVWRASGTLALFALACWPVTVAAQGSAGAPAAVACPRCYRAFDQVWLISTRGLGGCGNIPAPPNFFVQRRTVEGAWVASSIEEFLVADDPFTPIGFAIHGNWVSPPRAVQQGMMAYRQFAAGVPASQPVRFVIWSWPSDRIHGIIKDIRAKAARTNTDSKYLAWTLHQLNGQAPVSVIGFSYGARIATGALHVLAGGSLDGFALAQTPKPRTPIRAVLTAAALHNYWLAQGHYHGRALEVVDTMLLISNGCDMALKRYRFLDRSRTAAALGYTGPAGWSPHYGKVRIVDACRDVGKAHSWDSYLTSPRYTALQAATLRVGSDRQTLTSTEKPGLYHTIAK